MVFGCLAQVIGMMLVLGPLLEEYSQTLLETLGATKAYSEYTVKSLKLSNAAPLN